VPDLRWRVPLVEVNGIGVDPPLALIETSGAEAAANQSAVRRGAAEAAAMSGFSESNAVLQLRIL